jgi:hypothetical protein
MLCYVILCYVMLYYIYAHMHEMQLLDWVLVCCTVHTFVAFGHEGSSRDVHATKHATIYPCFLHLLLPLVLDERLSAAVSSTIV